MKRVVAKNYSIEKIADVYLAELARNETDSGGYVLPEILRTQNIFFDEEIIAGALQLLEDRKYIIETGSAGKYVIIRTPGDKVDIIIESFLSDSDANNLKTRNADFFLEVKLYKISRSGARFVRLGQVLDVQGRVEREAEHKKWKERLVTSAIALAVSILTMAVKSWLFDK